jgi:DNA-binding MarR family transcriptional regulator
MQRDDADRARTFLAASSAFYSAAQLALTFGWTVPQAQAVLTTLEHQRIVHRRRSAFDGRRSSYRYRPQDLQPRA